MEYAPETVWGAFRNAKILPIHSDPTLEDTDGDGLSDNKDPNKLKSDITIIELKKNNYIRVNYENVDDFCNWKTKRYPGSYISYGSSQDWFDNLSGLHEYDNTHYDYDQLFEKEMQDFRNGLHHTAKKGCGLIAISDLAIYLSFNDANIDLSQIGYDYKTNLFEYDSYMDYLLDMRSIFPVYPIVENIDPEFPGRYQMYLNSLLSKSYYAYLNTSLDADICYNKIEKMIKSDIPVIMSFSNPLQKLGNLLTHSDLNTDLNIYSTNDDLTTFVNTTVIENHYMTITGIIIYSDDVATKYYKEIPSNVMLQVSSFGVKSYVSFDEYKNTINPFCNILVLEEL